MDALGSLGSWLVFFAVSMGLMQLGLWRQRGGGLFSALLPGLLPALVLCGSQFWDLQQADLPEVKAERVEWAAFAKKMASEQAPGKEQAEDRAVLESVYLETAEAQPAGKFCLIMVVLAPLAVWLRRRHARHGLSLDPGPLSRWSVPWALVWLVLGPVFWIIASRHGLLSAPDWGDHLALNALTVGSIIFLFQGIVIVGAKMGSWAREPRTRTLAWLSMAVLAFTLLFADRFGLVQVFMLMLLVTGLLEPWVDLRRLNAPPPRPKGGDQA